VIEELLRNYLGLVVYEFSIGDGGCGYEAWDLVKYLKDVRRAIPEGYG